MDDVVPLRGREHEERIVSMLAMAQIHRAPEDALARAPDVAAAYVGSEHLELWGLERDGDLLAVLGIEPNHRDGVMLHDMAVWPSARGGGIGRALIAWLCERYPHATIFGDTLDESAGFYRSCGFEVLPTGGTLPDGEPVYAFSLRPR